MNTYFFEKVSKKRPFKIVQWQILRLIILTWTYVHVLLYGLKFNGEMDIVQFIFIQCVVYSLEQKIVLQFYSLFAIVKSTFFRLIRMTALPNKNIY